MRGEKLFGEVSGKRFASQSVNSVLFKGKLFSPMCFEGTCDTRLFNVRLKQMLIPNLTARQVLILDNATFHKPAESRKLIEAAECKFFFFHLILPDLNPTE